MARLDLGCGIKKKDGCIGVDRIPTQDTDVVADAEKGLPFADNTFEFIWISHVLEHVADLVPVMEEIWRVAVHGGTVEVRGPHFSSPDLVWGDPTHRRALTSSTFRYFAVESDWWYTRARFAVQSVVLKRNAGDSRPPISHWWHVIARLWDRALERLTNRSPLWVQRAERYYCRLWGFDELQVRLKVDKLNRSPRSSAESD